MGRARVVRSRKIRPGASAVKVRPALKTYRFEYFVWDSFYGKPKERRTINVKAEDLDEAWDKALDILKDIIREDWEENGYECDFYGQDYMCTNRDNPYDQYQIGIELKD